MTLEEIRGFLKKEFVAFIDDNTYTCRKNSANITLTLIDDSKYEIIVDRVILDPLSSYDYSINFGLFRSRGNVLVTYIDDIQSMVYTDR